MVSKAVACLALFVLIIGGYCGPVSRGKLQKINCEVDQNNSSSDESGQVTLCELMNHENNKDRSENKKKFLQGQDSSSSESTEHREDHGWNKEIRKAPEHQRMQDQHSHNMQAKDARENIQISRNFNGENSFNENNSQAEENQISVRH